MSDLSVSLSPHAKAPVSVPKIMGVVNLALMPALAAATWVFGWRALALTVTSVITAIVTEALIQKFFLKKPLSISDGSAVVTGMLLAFNVPATLPLPMMALGAFFAMLLGKWVFGGLGQNPFNPALVGRAFLLVSFPAAMTNWMIPGAEAAWNLGADVITGATPLGIIAESSGDFSSYADQLPSIPNLLFGFRAGSLGETSVLAITLGGLLMIALRVIPWQLPLMTLLGIGLVSGIAYLLDPLGMAPPVYHLLGGGAFLGSFFMVTDYSTSPMTLWGRIIFAFLIGVLSAVIRIWGSYPEGISYAILFMNAWVPMIDRLIKPKRFGHGVMKEAKNG